MSESQSVGIVGVGLIGGSIGLALRNPKRQVLGCDQFPEAEKMATSRECVDRIATLEEVCQCDVVFVGVPPAFVVETVAEVAGLKRPETVITDCSSIKSQIAQWGAKAKETQFVPGHPMAGHEKSGSGYASAWLFRGAKWILTPYAATSKSATRAVEELVKEMGALPVRLKPEEHDRHVALLSHLPHVIAGSLLLEAEGLEHWNVGAGSWNDLTRVGGVDPALWSQIFLGNREELLKSVEEFEGRLAAFREILAGCDSGELKDWLAKAREAKSRQTAALAAAIVKPKVATRNKRK